MMKTMVCVLLAPLAMLASNSRHAAWPTTVAISVGQPARAGEPPRDEASSPQVDHASTRADAPASDQLMPATDPGGRISIATRGVLGGPHDFSRTTGQVQDSCSACHVPHVVAVRSSSPTRGDAGANPTSKQAESPVAPETRGSVEPRASQASRAANEPALAQDAPQVSSSGALELYRIAGQRQVYAPGRFMPGPTSLICLSCHDGAVAPSTLGASHALLSTQRLDFAIPDGFVWHDHPIGVAYPDHRKGYRSRSEVERMEGLRLPEGRVECVSCHDPHGASGAAHLLSTSNRRSALCLGCHEK